MTVQAAREAFRALRIFSGLTAESFAFRCRGIIEEERDGEGEGDPSPAEWLRAAREVSWSVTTRNGRDKAAEARFVAFQAGLLGKAAA